MAFPIKYIEGNLIKNTYGEWWAYYRINPYNYAFTSPEEKEGIFSRLRQMFGQIKAGNIHVLVASVEESIEAIFKHSERYLHGSLAEIGRDTLAQRCKNFIHSQEKATQVEYQFYIGFNLLSLSDGGLKSYLKETALYFRDAAAQINHTFMGDFTTISYSELQRYGGLENATYNRLITLFDIQRLTTDETGYVVRHMCGQPAVPIESYLYHLPVEENAEQKNCKVRTYDILKLDAIEVLEHPRYLVYQPDGNETYCTYLTLEDIVSDLWFPGSEIFYQQVDQFGFAVDTSLQIEVIDNKKALDKVRGQKKHLKDMDDHAWKAGDSVDGEVTNAIYDVEELETGVKMSHEPVLCISYLIRVTAPDRATLEQRVTQVSDFYDRKNIQLVRTSGDMMKLREECIPSARRQNRAIVQRLLSDFPACLGIAAGTVIGQHYGIPLGYASYSKNLFCLRPWLAAQGIAGTRTNSLSMAFIGAMGGGKSFNFNLLIYLAVLYGARAVILDPKPERGEWKEMLPQIAHEIQISRLTKSEDNRGILDPFLMFEDVTDSEEIVLQVLTFLLGVSIQEGDRFPALQKAVKAVCRRQRRGLLLVIEELRSQNTAAASALADHLQSYAETGLATLLFSDGEQRNAISLKKRLCILQVDGLMLPNSSKPRENYTAKEILSVAVMMVVSIFNLKFIDMYPGDFKVCGLDEAWSLLKTPEGEELTDRLNRESRAKNAAVCYCVQNPSDLPDGRIKNSLGIVFLHRLSDKSEIKIGLELLGLNPEDEANIAEVQNLKNGECLMRDLYGRVNKVKFEAMSPQLFAAFDTTPKNENERREGDG